MNQQTREGIESCAKTNEAAGEPAEGRIEGSDQVNRLLKFFFFGYHDMIFYLYGEGVKLRQLAVECVLV